MPPEKCACCDSPLSTGSRSLSSVIVFKDTLHQVTLKQCVENITNLPSSELKLTEKICGTCEQELFISYKFRTKVLQTRKAYGIDFKVIDVASPEKKIQEIVEIIKVEDDLQELPPEIKSDEDHEEYIVASAHPYANDIDGLTKIEEDFIEEEYLEDYTQELEVTKELEIDENADFSQPKLNAEIQKIMKTRNRKSSQSWNCTMCDYKSKHSKKDLKIHMLRVHFPDEMHFVCKICQKRCSTSSELKLHVDKYHGESKQAKAVCGICNVGFPTGTKLHAHMIAEHSEGDRVPCDLCSATFKTMSNLKMHKKLHNDPEEVHECPICSKTFRISYSLTKHIKEAHSTNPKLFHCNECGQTAKSKKDIRLHLTRRHFPECKSYLCVDCGKMFESSHRLTDHIRSWHNRELRYECDICHRKFIHPASLRIHKSTHSKISPFSCDECGAAFKNLIYLSHHKKIHVTSKDFGCSQCPQFFKTKGYLATHMKNCHPTEELHCQICNTTYKNLLIFKNHIKMHQEGKANCEVCGKSYASGNNLRLHRRNVHGLRRKTDKIKEIQKVEVKI
ncbi:zinc finger protein 184-like [Culicoides brevitarsis]|uniref:zinc finger protein 184-like n=1 Tax=Culicoides brevitarsis TaxID=469753 RepID=UPI00307BE05C